MAQETQRRFALVAGEASGDLLAGLLLDGLQARWPQMQAVGIGGPQMLRRGFETWWPQEKLAVRGYVEVLRHYAEIAGIRRQLKARLLREGAAPLHRRRCARLQPRSRSGLARTRHQDRALRLPLDLGLARRSACEKLRAAADHVLCIFPFEPALLAKQGIAASYVGHPLANVIPMAPDRAAARAALGLDAEAPVVALLPGSRRSELRYLADRFFAAAALMQQARPELRFVAARAARACAARSSSCSRRARWRAGCS